MIKIAKIAHSPSGTVEPFEWEFDHREIAGITVKNPVQAKGHLLRVEEGIMLVIESLKATQVTLCSRCGKKLTLPLPFEGSEWLFYEKKPAVYDDENELLFIDRKHWELDPSEAIRQELILGALQISHCTKPCASFEEAKQKEEGTKALSGLKDLLK